MKSVIRKTDFKTKVLTELNIGQTLTIICSNYRECEAAASSVRMYNRRKDTSKTFKATLDSQTLTVQVSAISN